MDKHEHILDAIRYAIESKKLYGPMDYILYSKWNWVWLWLFPTKKHKTDFGSVNYKDVFGKKYLIK